MTGEDCIIYAWFLWCINGDSCLNYVLLMILLSKRLFVIKKIYVKSSSMMINVLVYNLIRFEWPILF